MPYTKIWGSLSLLIGAVIAVLAPAGGIRRLGALVAADDPAPLRRGQTAAACGVPAGDPK